METLQESTKLGGGLDILHLTTIINPMEANYAKVAQQSRLKVLDLVFKAQTSHIGSLFSCADIFAVLFDKIDLDKDKFILSAGWKAAMLYYHLWRKGRITLEELDSYCMDGSKFIGLAEPIHPDIPFAGGSMCMGLSAAVGFAYSKKLKGEDGHIYCLESDGGMQGGITWEAMQFANHHKLNNLVLIVDNNGFQAMGKVYEIWGSSLDTKCASFGWHVRKVKKGHDYQELERAIYSPTPIESYKSKPLVVIANTTKGKGVPRWENDNTWHYAQIKQDDYDYAKSCLSL